MEMIETINKLQAQYSLTDDELWSHWQAQKHLSMTDSESKLDKIPKETRNKIARFYGDLRKYGIFTDKLNQKGEITYQKLSDYKTEMAKLHKLREREILLSERPIQPQQIKELISQYMEGKK